LLVLQLQLGAPLRVQLKEAQIKPRFQQTEQMAPTPRRVRKTVTLVAISVQSRRRSLLICKSSELSFHWAWSSWR
jgi:hypothetical protein